MAARDPIDPDLGTLLRAASDRACSTIRVAIPARVELYNAADGTVDAQPLIRFRDSAGEAVSEPVVQSVPIAWPGTDSHRIAFPLAKGDTVLLIVADRDIDAWAGQVGRRQSSSVVDPATSRIHQITDAIAIPMSTGKRAPSVINGLVIEGDRIAIGKQGTELIQLLIDLLTALTPFVASNVVALGSPLAASLVTLPLLATIKGKLASFKGLIP